MRNQSVIRWSCFKNDSGSYDETSPLIIQSYLQNIVKENSAAQESAALRSATDGKDTCWDENFVKVIQGIRLHVSSMHRLQERHLKRLDINTQIIECV